jgi:general secretion pathway protein L
MNLTISDLRTHLTTAYNWWLGGWQDAWAMLPKPAALQTRPAVFQTQDGNTLTFHVTADASDAWQRVTDTSPPQGYLVADDDVLLRELNLPPLSERDIAAAVAMDVQFASPFPADDTHYGYNAHRQPNGSLRIEVALTRKSQLEQLQTRHPQQALFARGQRGAIPLQNDSHSQQSAWYRSPLTLGLSALLGLVFIAWIISPTLRLRAESMAHETALHQLTGRAAPLLQKREEFSTLQQQLESAHAFDKEHPAPQPILEQLSSHIPDSTWISQLNLRKDQLTLEGSSDNAIAIVSLLEKIPALNEVRLGASVNRDPRSGRENFQILARIQASAPDPISASGTKP